jgi:capsular polysaccharide biosynthesis protein
VTSREILKRLVRRFGLLLLLTAIGATAGFVYSAVKTPTYTAKAYVVAIGSGDPITALNFAQAYGRVATSGPVLAKAETLLGGSRDGLAGVTAATSPDAPVIEINAAGTSAQHTANLANSVANALIDYGGTRKADTKVSLALLAGALTPARPSSPKPPLELIVGAAGGLLIGGLAVLAGVGRASTAREKTARAESARAESAREEAVSEPTRYEARVDEVDEDEPEDVEVAQPLAIEQFSGVSRKKNTPVAITSYRASVPPIFLTPQPDDEADEDGAPAVPAIPGQRVVGRAVVYRAEAK